MGTLALIFASKESKSPCARIRSLSPSIESENEMVRKAIFLMSGEFTRQTTAEVKVSGIVALLRKIYLDKDDEVA